jgi:hypothetical protein
MWQDWILIVEAFLDVGCWNLDFSSLANYANTILTPKLIKLSVRALRIVAPFAVHQEAVFVTAGGQGDSLFPNAAFLLFQNEWGVFPVGEVPCEQDALRLWANIGESYFLPGVRFVLHDDQRG